MISPRRMSKQTVIENLKLYARVIANGPISEDDLNALITYALETQARMYGLRKD